jgi:FAD/FMN-containing dehydrogenase
MSLHPKNKAELARMLGDAHARRAKVAPPDLSALHRVLQYAPEDMTVKVECGLALSALQETLGVHGQWLPIDPPQADTLSIGALISADANGPRRYGYGGIREHLIGLQVVLADGRCVSSGGNVVKNVAGFDLMKLFIGAELSLGVPVEATFKLRPRPEEEVFLVSSASSLAELEQMTQSVLDSALTPTVLDWHRGVVTRDAGIRVVLGLAGTREDVAWERARAAELGFRETTDLQYDARFWMEHQRQAGRRSVLPSRLTEAVEGLGSLPFVARAGNGVLYAPGLERARLPAGVATLSQQLKAAFDPEHVLPELLRS